MKKVIIILSIIVWFGAFSINAQHVRERKVQFDMQVAQSFGLSDWNRLSFASDRLPRTTSSTDLRATVNLYFIKITFGVFGKFSVSDKLSVLPGLGVGFMTISAPACEAVLKEHDSNMLYNASYQWFGKTKNDYNNEASLGYLAFRLRFAYPVSPKCNLLLGLEYTLHMTPADFTETYTNYFNPNIVRTINHSGNRLNQLGFSVGISF